MTEPWKTSIEFTVTPTDDPDVVNVQQAGNEWPVPRTRVDYGGNNPGPATIAARAYFAAHPPKPAHPLADAKVGEWWALTWERDGFTEVAKVTSAMFTMSGISSARQVYVIPKAEADVCLSQYRPADELMELAL